MVWGSIHCAVSLPRELENLVVPPRETALLEQVQEALQCAGAGTFIRRISILLFIKGVPCEPGHRAENREWESARFFEISLTESHLVSFLGELSKSTKVQLALALTAGISAGPRKLARRRKPNVIFDLCAALSAAEWERNTSCPGSPPASAWGGGLHPPYGSVGVERDLVPTSALDGQSLMADGRTSVGSLFRLSGDGWGPDPHPAFGHPLPFRAREESVSDASGVRDFGFGRARTGAEFVE
jgi:hypothetical protein